MKKKVFRPLVVGLLFCIHSNVTGHNFWGLANLIVGTAWLLKAAYHAWMEYREDLLKYRQDGTDITS